MTDQKHTKTENVCYMSLNQVADAFEKAEKIEAARVAGLEQENLDLRRERDELREALDKIVQAQNGKGSFITSMIEAEKLLTKTKESV